MGYEYRYGVSVGDDGRNPHGRRKYKLEVRTNFILKSIDESERVLDTERFSDRLRLADDEKLWGPWPRAAFFASSKNKVDNSLRSRLGNYGMPDAQIRALVQTTFDLLVQDPSTIHVLVSVDVCTVQSEGEMIDSAIDRAVVPDTLTPLQLRWTNVMKKSKPLDGDLFMYLRRILVLRVREDADIINGEDDEMESCPICIERRTWINVIEPDMYCAYHEKHSIELKPGLALMGEYCPICLRETIIGAKIALLPCQHAFHDHCIFRTLLNQQSCPVCHFEIEYKPDSNKIRKMLDSMHITYSHSLHFDC